MYDLSLLRLCKINVHSKSIKLKNMKKSINNFGRELGVLLLCAGFVFSSCAGLWGDYVAEGFLGDEDAYGPVVDLSSSATANCYIVSKPGIYKFKTVKGNDRSLSVGDVASASVLWESFGTDVAPKVGDLISDVQYEDGVIVFKTPLKGLREGNAVIAAKNASGTILWSWHIWLTDQPQGQVYYNNAGTMMDRNLGATSATPGKVGALGLIYQWGRKDPFVGSSSINSNVFAKSTNIDRPEIIPELEYRDKLDQYGVDQQYVAAHPTAWGLPTPLEMVWRTSEAAKSIYDPCPAGWRVPDGGYGGVWDKALAGRGYTPDFNKDYRGCYVSRFGADFPIWYPAAGRFWVSSIEPRSISLYAVGSTGTYLAATSGEYYKYGLVVSKHTFHLYTPLDAGSVRCIRE